MYSPHTEHDQVWDKWNNEWAYVSHFELEKRQNRFRFVYHGDTFTSSKTGKVWQYYKKGDELGVRPYKPASSTPSLATTNA
jgi:hypothetical protein